MTANSRAFGAAAIHVFVQFYRPHDESRLQEIKACLNTNIANSHIDQLHVWVEAPESPPEILASDRITVMPLARRVTYADWLTATNALPPGDISLLVNADIFFDETLGLLRAQALRMQENKVFLALTRYNRVGEHWSLNTDPHWTQDTWGVVRGHEPFAGTLLQEAELQLGKPGCDNKIAYVMHSYGFTVSNPCRVLVTGHLHAQQTREYHNVTDRLLGLYAFAHPVSVIGSPSRLEFQLLTRASRDPQQVVVANWLNQRADQVLMSVTQIPAQKAGALTREGSSLDAQSADPRFLAHVPREYVTLPDEAAVEVLENYSPRYSCQRGETYLYFIDSGWPLCARIRLDDLPPHFEAWPTHRRFALGFLPPMLDLAPFNPSATPGADASGIFWQYPCRTEQSAAENAALHPGYLPSEGGYEVYLGLPWATFYDRLLVMLEGIPDARAVPAEIEVLAARLQALRDYLSTQGKSLRIHTVCQHIDWANCLHWFQLLGVTDLWLSHKQGGRDWAGSIRLHAWHLYAVNVLDRDRQKGLSYRPVAQKPLLASFIGAHMPHYLGDIRVRLAEAFSTDDICVSVKDQWHFNRAVYECQAVGAQVNQNETEANAMEVYNCALSDSRFSLCPAGSGPNTLRLWESLAIGCVPVILSDTHELPALSLIAPNLDLTWDDVLLRYPEQRVGHLEAYLRAIPEETVVRMQRGGLELFEAIQAFSPVGVKSALPPDEEDLLWFKPQQLHRAHGMRADVTGLSTYMPAWLADDTAELTIHFDKPEEVLALRVVRTGDETQTVRLSLSLARAYGNFVDAFEITVTPGSRWVAISGVAAALPRLAESVRIRRNSDAKDVLLRVEFKVRRNALADQLREADSNGTLQAIWENPSTRALEPFDARNLENGEIFRILRDDSVGKDAAPVGAIFPSTRVSEKNLLGDAVSAGVSLVVSLMNRNALVSKNLENWLAQSIDELILLDWSSDEPVADLPEILRDPRVRVIRVPDQTRFCRTWAQNLGIRCARFAHIMKCDADVSFHGDFFASHPLSENEFWVGEWRQARDWNERHLNGNIYCSRANFIRVHGYDERLVDYGHDDTDLTWRLIISGCRKRVFAFTMLYHQPHGNRARIERLERFIHPEVLTRYQRLISAGRPLWSPAHESRFRVLEIMRDEQRYEIRIASDFVPALEPAILSRARRTVASWYSKGVDVMQLSEVEIDTILMNQLG